MNDSHQIINLYSKLSYFDKYGTDVFIFFILLIILLLAISYFNIMANITPIKDNWAAERCKPHIIPFAGLINTPPNESMSDFTEQNFEYCMQNILSSISSFAVQPITYITSIFSELFNSLQNGIQSMRTMMSSVRSDVTTIIQDIMGRILNIMIPIQQILISFRDAMEKVKGILTAGVYTCLGTYYTLQSLMGAIAQFIILLLVILASILIILWIIPFTWPFAASMSVIFVSISVPLALIIAFMADVLNVQITSPIPGLPSASSCFDKNTELKMNDGLTKKISEIVIGDVLINNNKVTSVLKLDALNKTMFKLDDIIVSSTHQVKYNNNWIYVYQHPERKLVFYYDEPIIYCINTELKIIEINNSIFMDWDELTEQNILNLKKTKNISLKDISEKYNSGFTSDTIIKMKDGIKKQIKDIQIGDVLFQGEIVYGLVELTSDKLYSHDLGKNRFIQGSNNLIYINNFVICNTLDLDKKYLINNEPKLYHLLTNTKSFLINNVTFLDYNSILEFVLED